MCVCVCVVAYPCENTRGCGACVNTRVMCVFLHISAKNMRVCVCDTHVCVFVVCTLVGVCVWLTLPQHTSRHCGEIALSKREPSSRGSPRKCLGADTKLRPSLDVNLKMKDISQAFFKPSRSLVFRSLEGPPDICGGRGFICGCSRVCVQETPLGEVCLRAWVLIRHQHGQPLNERPPLHQGYCVSR